jgi:hypothetical protein
MIGRLNGEFPPPIDPLLYRHNKNGKKDTLDPIYYHDGDDDNNNTKKISKVASVYRGTTY